MVNRVLLKQIFLFVSLFAGAFQSALAGAGEICLTHLAPPPVLVVDAYSSGNEYASLLAARGHPVFHTRSFEIIPKSYRATFRPDDFLKTDFDFIEPKNLEAAIAFYRRLGIGAVITGSEPGGELADDLRDGLGLPGNLSRLSEARRNKFWMHEALWQSGDIEAIRHIASDNLKGIQRWFFKENKGRWPVVLKPLDSAGTEGVSVCHSMRDLQAAFVALYGTYTKMGRRIDRVLAQEFLHGPEFVVDLVARNGRFLVSDLWRYVKRGASRATGGSTRVYDRDEMLDFHSPEAAQLVEYAIRAAQILGVRNGPAHIEIILTPDRGPVLVELGARVIGGGTPKAIRAAVGVSPIDLTIEAALYPDLFDARLAAGPLVKRKHAWVVQFISPRAGKLVDLPYLKKLGELKSMYDIRLDVRPGDDLAHTVDLASSPGQVLLVHDNLDQLRRDYRQIRKWENNGFYVLAF